LRLKSGCSDGVVAPGKSEMVTVSVYDGPAFTSARKMQQRRLVKNRRP